MNTKLEIETTTAKIVIEKTEVRIVVTEGTVEVVVVTDNLPASIIIVIKQVTKRKTVGQQIVRSEQLR